MGYILEWSQVERRSKLLLASIFKACFTVHADWKTA